jgi:hypothetical protein
MIRCSVARGSRPPYPSGSRISARRPQIRQVRGGGNNSNIGCFEEYQLLAVITVEIKLDFNGVQFKVEATTSRKTISTIRFKECSACSSSLLGAGSKRENPD